MLHGEVVCTGKWQKCRWGWGQAGVSKGMVGNSPCSSPLHLHSSPQNVKDLSPGSAMYVCHVFKKYVIR